VHQTSFIEFRRQISSHLCVFAARISRFFPSENDLGSFASVFCALSLSRISFFLDKYQDSSPSHLRTDRKDDFLFKRKLSYRETEGISRAFPETVFFVCFLSTKELRGEEEKIGWVFERSRDWGKWTGVAGEHFASDKREKCYFFLPFSCLVRTMGFLCFALVFSSLTVDVDLNMCRVGVSDICTRFAKIHMFKKIVVMVVYTF